LTRILLFGNCEALACMYFSATIAQTSTE
jgi:hypothetical protein